MVSSCVIITKVWLKSFTHFFSKVITSSSVLESRFPVGSSAKIIAGELIGALFYYISFGIAVIKITDRAVSLLRRFYAFIFKVISAPFRLIKKVFSALFGKISKLFRKTEKKSTKMRKKLLPKLRLYVYNLLGILFANKPIGKKGGRDFGKGKEEEKAS